MATMGMDMGMGMGMGMGMVDRHGHGHGLIGVQWLIMAGGRGQWAAMALLSHDVDMVDHMAP